MIKVISNLVEKIRLNLQLFGEGGGTGGAGNGGGPSGAGAGGADGADGAAAESTQSAAPDAAAKDAKPGKSARTGDLSQVKYGIQDEEEAKPDAAEPEEKPEPQKEAPKKSFDELMKSDPEYQRELQKRIDQAINKRFAKAKAAEEQSAKLQPALNLLAAKYGVEAGNSEALINAINSDSDLIEQQAMDAGMEPEAYREFQRLKAENEALKKAEQERQRQESTDKVMQQWQREAEEARRIYPGLDLATESRNEQFCQLLGAGISVRVAYEVVHQDEIQSGLIQRAASEARKKTVASIAAKSGRPRENGASKPQAAAVKTDPRTLTIKDFEEIDRRLARGERIRF